VAAKSGPASVRVVGLAEDKERRRERMPPEVSRFTPSNDNSGLVPVLVTWALSPMNMKENVFVA
jgi:hypothetical protein